MFAQHSRGLHNRPCAIKLQQPNWRAKEKNGRERWRCNVVPGACTTGHRLHSTDTYNSISDVYHRCRWLSAWQLNGLLIFPCSFLLISGKAGTYHHRYNHLFITAKQQNNQRAFNLNGCIDIAPNTKFMRQRIMIMQELWKWSRNWIEKLVFMPCHKWIYEFYDKTGYHRAIYKVLSCYLSYFYSNIVITIVRFWVIRLLQASLNWMTKGRGELEIHNRASV